MLATGNEMRLQGTVFVLVCMLLLSSPLALGLYLNPPSPAVESTVVLDLVILDKHGRHLTSTNGLDLQLLEDGSRRQVGGGDSAPAEEQIQREWLRSESDSERQLYTNIPLGKVGAAGERTFLLVDLLNTLPEQRPVLVRALKQLLQRKELSLHLAIYGLASRLTLLQDSAGDPQGLLAVLQDAQKQAGQPIDFSTPDTGSIVSAPHSSHQGPQDYLVAVKAFAEFRQEPPFAEKRAETIAAFKTIARALQGTNGRKSLIWFSADFPCATASLVHSGNYDCSDRQAEWQAAFRDLQEARLSLYPANAVEVRARSHDDGAVMALERPVDGGREIRTNRDTSFISDLMSRDLAMRQVAETTGGRFMRGKSLKQAVETAREDEQALEVQFASSQQEEIGIHHVELSTCSGVTVLYRRTIYGRAAALVGDDAGAIHQEIVDALTEPLQATSIALAAKKQQTTSGIDLFIDPRGLTFNSQPDGTVKTAFDVATAALSPSYRLLAGNTDRFTRTLSAEEFQSARSSGVTLHLAYTPQPHAQWLRLLVRDLKTGRIGSLDVPLSCCEVIH
jgi:VWFA-related protein